MQHPSHYRAFSLVELSIVLVILGLLVGGILAGKSLIRAAELRTITREYQAYVVALSSFRDKYFALPGDMPNAVRVWGAAAGATTDGIDPTCAALATASTTATTCNGDGNGAIASISSTPQHELYRAWQQLQNAGLIEGAYAGVALGGGISLGVNIPRSKASGGWAFYYLGNYSGDASWFSANYNNALMFGENNATDYLMNPALNSEEAWNIDTKIDDGYPQSGKVVGYKNAWQPNCTAASNTSYDLTTTTKACAMIFITGY